MSSSIPEQFTGYAAMNKEDGKALKTQEYSYTPQKWSEELVDIKVEASAICGSCLHTLTSGWGSTSFPCIAGHEIVGKIVRAGSDSGHKVDTRVGVGAQAGSCQECDNCKAGKENLCSKGMIGTYQGKWKDGSVAQGGYANYVRVQGRFAIEIPKELPSEIAAPMMCGGVTTYSPLSRAGIKKGMNVAVVGIGGLGHFGVMWAVAMGATVYAISHSDSKKQDAEKLGVKPEHFIIAKDQKDTVKQWKGTFDFILCTSFQKDLPLAELYFPLLKAGGELSIVGLPEQPLNFSAGAMIHKQLTFSGSIIGSPQQLKEMLAFAVKHNVKSWIEERDMKDVNQALADMNDGKARYRYVLKN